MFYCRFVRFSSFFGAPLVFTGWVRGFKSVVYGNATFLNCSLMCNFVASSAFEKRSTMTSNSVVMVILELPSVVGS